jgi:gliding motility-associated-like protein
MTVITRIISSVFLFLCLSMGLFSQITYPISGDYGGMPVETCSGYFVDSGLDTLNFYQPNEDYTITFCSSDIDNELIRFHFNFFQLAEGDILYVYDGDSDASPLLIAARNNDLHNEEIWFSNECAFFRFVSDENSPGALGWFATISCYTFCDGFWAEAETATESFNYCPYDEGVNFIGNAGYYSENAVYNPADFIYSWNFQGDVLSGQNPYHTYEGPGAYPFSLSVFDTANNCTADIINVIKIGTYPTFHGTGVTPDTICAKSQATLYGTAQATTWTGFDTSVEGTFPIPDGTGFSWTSTLTFDVFESLAEITEESEFDKVCLKIEHVNFGQLKIELECPNGTTVILSDYSAGGANLGEPVVWDNTTPGKGYDYCFRPIAAYGTMSETSPQFHEYTDNAGNFYFNAAYLPSGTYTPVESFAALTGCSLNGDWTISVTDNAAGDNGFVFEWSLFFSEELYPDSLIFTPHIIEKQWFENDNPLSGNPSGVTKEEEGEYEFVFKVTDDFGCKYDTLVVLEVLRLPKAEIISELELPVCEGDSTLLSLVPLDDNPYNWIYQWEKSLIILEGSIYDTIMAKETGNYAVMVTDTLSTCSDYFDIDVTEQNCDLTIPNVFTPNNDGINDYFEIENLEHYPGSTMVIYNRNGRKVFEHNDYDGNWWDGRGAPDGTYFYVLTYTRMGKRKQIHGVITLLR